ncbi:MAG: ABC transporter substrate-binding protein [Sulfurimonas sp.]|jgi:signal transduction histidine kinase/ABC-type nitrate/sulfonate/bicarbonate transport system substrate-binding protein|nr:ABC transporter substrate-binding protein [Sulfurimonas sp.]
MKSILLFTLFTALLFAQKTPPQELEKVSVQFHWKYQFEFAGFIAAKELGFYEDVGLDVELREYKPEMNVVDEVLSNRANYGVYNSNILLEYMRSKPLMLLSSYFKRSALVLITKPYIKVPEDLIGKTIISSGADDFEINFGSLFERHGVDTKLFKFKTHTYEIEDFLQSDVDAMTAFISDQPYRLDKMGYKYNIINPSDYGTFNLQLELFTSQEEAQRYAKRTAKFRDATIRGWEYALLHQDQIVDIIYKKYSQQNSKDALKNEAKEILKLILPYTYSIGYIDTNFLQKQLEIFKAKYDKKNKKTIENFIFETEKNARLEFSKTEHLYIRSSKPISVCIDANDFPYDGYENKKHTGIMSDVYREIAKKTDLRFQPVLADSKEDLAKKVKNKECDLVSMLPTTSKRFESIITSQAFARTPFTLITKLDKSFVQNTEQLESKTLIVERQEYKNYLQYIYPNLIIEVEEDMNEMMKSLLQGKVFAALELDEKADYVVNKYGYGKLKINGFLAKDRPLSLSIGVQEDDPILLSIIEKSLAKISEQKIDKIFHSWRLTRYQNQTDYGLIIKILIVAGFILLTLLYYQRKLKRFNIELKKQVAEKTKELREINQSLEKSVEEKVNEIIQKDKLLTAQSKQAVMGEMISMIAHQWRQPLSTITLQISNLQIKKMMGEDIDDLYIDNTLAQISDTIIYLSDTVDDFQTYFRPDKKPSTIEVHELLNKVINFVQPRLKGKQISIVIKKEKDIMIDVYANELTQVILNIVNNAIDALDEINKEGKTICLSAEVHGKKVEIMVEDNGPGILEENREKLFEPYFSTKGKNGTGLGLYMSQMIVEKQFNGKIQAQNSEEGCTFIVSIDKSIA